MNVEPVVLRGRLVRLEPMTLDHVAALALVGLEPELWRWIPTAVSNVDDMRGYVEIALEERSRGISMPFVTIDQATDRVIGSTRFANIDKANRRLEIGWTWLASAYRRTGSNTEAKLLMLTYAFEVLGANRVEFKTDALNAASRAAIARIGATEEGTFRKHLVTQSGRVRDSVYFSIIDTEWPSVKTRLEGLRR